MMLSHHHHHHHHHHQQALKCPRCDSTNTKFCYYNNYNLSQPRHFCKSCRRYWTKGGVLRNIPIGGGCRKNKRSKAKQPPPEQPYTAAALGEVQAAASSPPPKQPEQKSSSQPCSEGSSLTAATAVAAAATEVAIIGSTPVAASPGGGFCNMREHESRVVTTVNLTIEGACMKAPLGHTAKTGASMDVGNLAGLTTAPAVPFSTVPLSQSTDDPHQWQGLTVGNLFDQTVQMDASWPSDWQLKDQGGLFDVPTTVDQAYWGEGQSQWTDRDQGQFPSLYLPRIPPGR